MTATAFCLHLFFQQMEEKLNNSESQKALNEGAQETMKMKQLADATNEMQTKLREMSSLQSKIHSLLKS